MRTSPPDTTQPSYPGGHLLSTEMGTFGSWTSTTCPKIRRRRWHRIIPAPLSPRPYMPMISRLRVPMGPSCRRATPSDGRRRPRELTFWALGAVARKASLCIVCAEAFGVATSWSSCGLGRAWSFRLVEAAASCHGVAAVRLYGLVLFMPTRWAMHPGQAGTQYVVPTAPRPLTPVCSVPLRSGRVLPGGPGGCTARGPVGTVP